ncbi:tape measure protein [Kitasatospora aureofaciens]|uniref:tape measure protein n=1 Tax=Kitasatospora aureofaciens TaxID=1894 RepID=UPI00340E76DA
MAGNGTARSAGVAYIDLAVGDTKQLVADITRIVSQAADVAQEQLHRAFDVSGSAGSFNAIVDAAQEAATEAGSAISRSLSVAAEDGSSALAESITSAVKDTAESAAEGLTERLADAGRSAGEQLAFNFEEAAKPVLQLSFFDEEDLIYLAEREGRKAGESLSTGMAEAVNESTGSWGSFALPGIRGYAEEARTSIVGALRSAGEEGGSSMSESISEFGKGIQYSVGSWAIGSAIGMAITSGVSSALDAAKQAIFGFNAQMQSARISYGTLLGSDQAGSAMLDELKKFTLSTPFQFTDITEGAQKLLALGINARDVIPDLTALGDATSALGGDAAHMNSLVQIFGEMQAKGQIFEAQIRELQIRGVPALQILANEYGVTTGQMQEMIKAGKVMADDALPKLVDGIEKGTRSTQAMGNEMARQSATFTGSLSNLKDGTIQFAAAAFKPIFDQVNGLTAKAATFASGGQLEKFVTPVANAVSHGMSEVGGFFSKLFRDLAPAGQIVKDLIDDMLRFSIVVNLIKVLGPAILVVAQAIGAIGHNKIAAEVIAALVESFIALKAAQEAWNVVMAITNAVMEASPITQVILGVSALVIGIVALYQHSKTFRDVIGDIASFFVGAWREAVDEFDGAKNVIVSGFHEVSDFLSSVFHSGPAQGFISGLVASFQFLGSFLMSTFRVIESVVLVSVHGIASGVLWLWRDVVAPAFAGIAAVAVWLWKEVFDPVIQGIWFGLRLLGVIIFTLVFTPFVIMMHLLKPVALALWHDVFEPMWNGISKGALYLWHQVLSPFFSAVGELFSGKIVTQVKALWHEYIDPAFRGIGNAADWLWKSALEPAFRGISDLAQWLWTNALQPALSGIGDVFNWLIDWVVRPWWDAIVATFHGVADAAIWLWKNGIEPTFQGIGDLADWLWRNVFKPAFEGIGNLASWLWREALKPAFDAIGNAWDWLWRNIVEPATEAGKKAFQELGHWASWLNENAIQPSFNAIHNVITSVLSSIKQGFKEAVDGISSMWNGLTDVFRGPLNFIINTFYTHGIREVWDFIAEKVGIPDLPEAPHFATGGIIGGPKSAGDWIPFYGTAGEGVLTVDEMDALGGPGGFNALRALLSGKAPGQGEDGHFKHGGILDSIGSAINKVTSTVSSGLGDLAGFAKRVVRGGLQVVAKDMLKPVLNGLGDMMPGDSILKKMLVGVPSALIDQVIGWLGGQDKKDNAKATAGLPGDVSGWIVSAEQLTGVGADWTAGLATIIQNESGGNPRAINNWDSNAAAGDPSRGLMQTIGATFESYRLPSLPDDIYDPVANIVAGIRYIISAYGSIGNVPGIRAMARGGSYVGYATGTDNASPGWHWVGERGPELLHFGGGETVLNHRDSIRASRAISAPISFGTAQGVSPMAPPNVLVKVYIDGKELDRRIDVKLERSHSALAQMLEGGRIQ